MSHTHLNRNHYTPEQQELVDLLELSLNVNDTLVEQMQSATLAASQMEQQLSAANAANISLQKQVDMINSTKYWIDDETISLPVISAAGSVDINVPWRIPAPVLDYSCAASIAQAPVALLGNLTATVKSKSLSGCVVTVKNSGLIALSLTGVPQLHVIAARGYRPTA